MHEHYATEDPAAKMAEARQRYLTWLAAEVNNVPLHEVDAQHANPQADALKLNLCDVYIGLDTETIIRQAKHVSLRDEYQRRLLALEAVRQTLKTVLVDEPGSGKSTFVHHLIYSLATYQLAPDTPQLQAFYKIWTDKAECGRLPVRVILRDFDAWRRSLPAEAAQAKHLFDFVARGLRDNKHEAAIAVIEQALNQGTALVVLDGLDEVITFEQRKYVRDAITRFAKAYHKDNRYVLTCRNRSYEAPEKNQEDVRVADFAEHKLAEFDDEKIEAFVKAWYAELVTVRRLDTEAAANKRDKLMPPLKTPEFRRMASNPLQLTLMAWVHTEDELPERRAQLYDKAINLLLWHRENKKREKEGRVVQTLAHLLEGVPDFKDQVGLALAQAAYKAHAQISAQDQDNDRDKLADVSESDLVILLAELKYNAQGHPDKAWAQTVVEAICYRSGLLARRIGNNLTFPHRTFQEYLAASYLISQRDFTEKTYMLAENADTLAVWREVILLAVGKDLYVNKQTERLKPAKLARKLLNKAQGNLSLAIFAAEVLLEVGIPEKQAVAQFDDDALLNEMRGYLQQQLGNNAIPAKQRAAVGDALARLGDPRFYGPDKLCLPKDETLGFIKVPASKFYLGTRPADAERMVQQFKWKREWLEDEISEQILHLNDFYLARYPTTVAQFRVFCKAADNDGFRPENPACLRDPDSRPVRYVTWFEAMQYAAWLNQRLQKMTDLPTGLQVILQQGKPVVRLPSEVEWEKAAKGGINSARPRQIFTWGDTPTPNFANYHDTGINDTSVVGCFSGGHGPYGHADLLGNVWEWQHNVYAAYPYKVNTDEDDIKNMKDSRALRGGSWNNNDQNARCALRFRNRPDNHFINVGFRVGIFLFPT